MAISKIVPVNLKIADYIIKIRFVNNRLTPEKNFLYQQICLFFKPFIVIDEKKPYQFEIVLGPAQQKFKIKREKKDLYVHLFKKTTKNKITSDDNISFIQFKLLILAGLQELLIKGKAIFFHASAINNKGEALLFTGPSGAGKTTAIQLLGERCSVLAEDSCIIKKCKNRFYFYQSPLEDYPTIKKTTKGYLIKKIFFLKKASFFKTVKIQKKDSFINKIAKQAWMESIGAKDQLRLAINFFMVYEDFYYLYFAKDEKKLAQLIS